MLLILMMERKRRGRPDESGDKVGGLFLGFWVMVRARVFIGSMKFSAGESGVAAALCHRSPRRWRE
jgi:hypothetical protein